MTKQCDHTSVGMLVWRDEKLLLIERAKYPFGFAVPAGHVDADQTFEAAATRELKEEVGLDAQTLELIGEKRKENPCRRENGTWHYWKIYKVSAQGELRRSEDETKRAGWYTPEQVRQLGKRTEEYLEHRISEDDWAKSPGLEPVMHEWLKELNII